MILVIINKDYMADNGDDILASQSPYFFINIKSQSGIELIAPNVTQVIASGIKEQIIDQFAGVFQVRRIARSQFAIDIDQGF